MRRALLAGAAVAAMVVCATPAAMAKESRDTKVVYLTFDDGPEPATDRPLLHLLGRKHVPATFFLVGSALHGDPKAAMRLWLSGHAVGNHTYSHADLTRLSLAGIDHEVLHMQRMLGPAAGRCVRPPYGATNHLVAGRIHALGLASVMWTIDPQDWARQDADYLVSHVLSRVQHRSIVLMHDGGGHRPATVAAVRALIPRLRARGYEFRSIPSCRVPLRGNATGMAKVPPAPEDRPEPEGVR